MHHTGTHSKQTAWTLVVLSVFIMFFLMSAIPGLVAMSHAKSKNIKDNKKPVSSENITRWENLSETQKDHFRKLYKQYQSMSVEKQTLLLEKKEIFNKLPENVRNIIQNNYKTLKVLSDNDRKSFFRLIRKYQKLPSPKKALVHKAFRKVKTLSKAKQLELFYLLIAENTKTKPEIRKLIKNFLIQAKLLDSSTTTPNIK